METAKKRYGVIADFYESLAERHWTKVALLIQYLRKMNDDLNIPHCIKNYGPDSYPAEQGFVPERSILRDCLRLQPMQFWMPAPAPTQRQPSQEEMEKLLKCCYYDTEVDF